VPGGVGHGTSPPVPADEYPAPHRAPNVLVERIAAALVNHEPGWRLPRASELARRHNVSTDEVHAALDELVARQLARQSADGHLYRASPAEYLISVDGLAGLGAMVDPMGRKLTCLSYGAARQPAPEAAAAALRVRPGEPVSVLRLVWAVDGVPGAVSTTYLARHRAQPQDLAAWLAAAANGSTLPVAPPAEDETIGAVTVEQATSPDRMPAGPPRRESGRPSRPWAVSVQMDLPPVSVAKRLRLYPGQLAVLVTILSRQDSSSGPAGLTATVLRPDMFSVSLVTARPAAGGDGIDPAWSLAAAEYRL
jgi:UTRA domain